MPLVIGQDTNPNRTPRRLHRVVMRRRSGNSLLTDPNIRPLHAGSVNSSSRRAAHFLLPFFLAFHVGSLCACLIAVGCRTAL